MKKSVNVYVSGDLSVSENIGDGFTVVEENNRVVQDENVNTDEKTLPVNIETETSYTKTESDDLLFINQEIEEQDVITEISATELKKTDPGLNNEATDSGQERPFREEQYKLDEKSTVRHGEYVIVNKPGKKKKHRKTKLDWNVSQGLSGQRRLQDADFRERDLSYKEPSSETKDLNKVDGKTPITGGSDTNQNNSDIKKTEVQETNSNIQKEDKEGKDLGADIIVLIVIGVIAGIAGFSYIFSQLGLLSH